MRLEVAIVNWSLFPAKTMVAPCLKFHLVLGPRRITEGSPARPPSAFLAPFTGDYAQGERCKIFCLHLSSFFSCQAKSRALSSFGGLRTFTRPAPPPNEAPVVVFSETPSLRCASPSVCHGFRTVIRAFAVCRDAFLFLKLGTWKAFLPSALFTLVAFFLAFSPRLYYPPQCISHKGESRTPCQFQRNLTHPVRAC